MEALSVDRDRSIRVIGGTILVGVCFLFGGVAARLVHINTTLAPRLSALVRAQQAGKTTLPGRRGSILDSGGRVLAGSRQRKSAFADPKLIEDFVETARRLGPALNMPAGQIEQTLRENAGRRFCWLSRLLDPRDADAVRALGIRGIGLRDEPQRHHPMGSLLAATVGIVGREGVGLEGLELQYNKHLQGRDGFHAALYDGGQKRRPIWWREGLSRSARDGGHVVLTMDSVIQEVAERELRESVEEFGAESGVVVVMSPRTGAVLAMAQHPTFDPDDYGASPAAHRRNRVICDAVEPGSIYKPFVAAGALVSGVVDTTEEIDCFDGQHYFGRRLLHDSSPRGRLTLAGVLTKSSNIGMGLIGHRMGNRAIHSVVRSFGFGERTGVLFPGEATGMVLPLSRWNSYSTTSVPMGQEIAATPLQLATAFCALVNGGYLLRPHLVESLLDAEGRIVASFKEREVVRRVLPREVANYMARVALVGVVEQGGGRPAALDDWQVLGKTGTAQVPYVDRRGYEPGAYIGSFVAAVPAEDPHFVVLMMVHKPDVEIGYYGTTVSAPAVGRIMGEILSYAGVPASPDGDRS